MAQRQSFLTNDPTGLPARRAALRLLDAVLRRGETLDVAEHAALQGLRNPADKALAKAIVGEALRWLVDLDALIDSATRLPLAPDAKARSVLRLMLAQWLRLETPPHAVVATGLELLGGGPRRLAHGVFSTLTKRPAALPAAPTLPERVRARWGDTLAEAVASGLAVPPPLDLTLRDPATTAVWAERLEGESLLPGHVRLSRGTRVEDLAGYAEGAWWVQDLAASLPARLLGQGQGQGQGRRVLDLCCAPGGKTLQLAAAGWQVTALDSSKRRLERVEQNLARTRLAAELVQADALTWENTTQYDAVLLDAPCSATGTARRHPDVLHRIGQGQIAELAALQARLLERAAGWVRPGGTLVFATCSLEAAEGQDQAAPTGFALQPVSQNELPAGLTADGTGVIRTHPGMLADLGGLDGFFIARWST